MMLKTKIPVITFYLVQKDHLKTYSISVTRVIEKNIELIWHLKKKENIYSTRLLFSNLTLLSYVQITFIYNVVCPLYLCSHLLKAHALKQSHKYFIIL